MATLQEQLASKASNPANPPEKRTAARERVPMSLPVQKLQVPDIPGYRLYWMRGDAARIAQAQRAGYTFVTPEEVDLNTVGVADGDHQGSTDLGSRVSVVAGGMIEGSSEAARLYLMKIPEEFWREDQATLAARNEQIAAAIRGDGLADPSGDNSNRYVKNPRTQKTLFHPKSPNERRP